MLFAIDIDGTIAGDDQGHALARYLNRKLALGISNTIIETLAGYQDFVALKQVQTYGQTASEQDKARYIAACQAAQHDPEVQWAATPLPGAVEGVHTLAHYGTIAYVTCRKDESREPTQAWLTRYGFPQPDQVHICQHYHYKYIQAHTLSAANEPIVIIDDRAQEVISFFRRLVKEQYAVARSVYKRCAIVAFGSEQAPPVPSTFQMPIIALASWEKNTIEQAMGLHTIQV